LTIHIYINIIFRDNCEKKIQDCQKELLKWIRRINERLQDHKANLELQEKKETLERLEGRVCECMLFT
jgi:DNA-binding transcriptional regulator GbsR (MarR family)